MKNTPMQHSFVIPGNPIPLARARIKPNSILNGGTRRMWDPQKELKLVTALTLKGQFDDCEFFVGAVHLIATFFMPIPSSREKKNKCGDYHHVKPDLSNLLKYIEDISSGILYKDDCIIASSDIKKVYDKNPRTEFTIISLE